MSSSLLDVSWWSIKIIEGNTTATMLWRMRSSVNERKSAVTIELALVPIDQTFMSLDVVDMLLQYCSVALAHMSPHGPFKDIEPGKKIWY